MELVSQSMSSIVGGVSQMPPALRPDSQFSEQINTLPVLGKLARRPPLLHTAKLDSAVLNSAFVQRLGEYNVIVSGDGSVRIVDVLTGTLQTVVIKPEVLGYLTGGTYKGVVVGDTAYLLNTAVTAGKRLTTSPSATYEAFFYVRQGDYSTKYTAIINGISVAVTTPNNTAVTDKVNIATDVIAKNLAAGIVANGTLNTLFTVTRYGSTVRVARFDAGNFTATGSDGLGDKGMVIIKGTVQQFSDLPTLARPGAIVEVTGDGSTAFSRYYVQYAAGLVGQNGTWTETLRPNALTSLDPSTLPVRVAKNGSDLNFNAAYALPAAQIATSGVSRTDTAISDTTVDADGNVQTALYPRGATYSLIVYDPVTPGLVENSYLYTVTGETETAETVAAGLGAIITASGAYVVTVSGAFITLDTGLAPPIVQAFPTWDSQVSVWSPTLSMTANQYVGYELINVTKGFTTTVTANSAKILTAGDSTLTFDPNDVIEVRQAGDFFVVEQCPWDLRQVGDDTTAPFPSFIGQNIIDIFVTQGRLGFVFKANCVLSRAGSLFNFFRQTATEVLSSDPIDVTATTSGVTAFHSAVEWNGQIYLWTDQAQYALGGNPLTPSSVSITKVSGYLSAPVRPVVGGERIFFVAMRSGFPHLMDYHTHYIGYQRENQATDLGLHIPTYIQGNPLMLAVDDAKGIVLLNTDTNGGQSLYCYSYKYNENDQLAQAAWGRWDFATGRILALDIVDGVVGLVMSYRDGTCLNQMAFDADELIVLEGGNLFDGVMHFDGSEAYDGNGATAHRVVPAYLDRHVKSTSLSVTYANGVTTWTLPYAVAVGEGTVAVTFDNPADGPTYSTFGGQLYDGTAVFNGNEEFDGGVADVLPVTRPSSTTVAATGDYSNVPVHIGVLYNSASTLSTLYMRGKDGSADTRGRLQLRFLNIDYVNLTELVVTVTAPGKADRIYTKSSQFPRDGTFSVPIQEKADNVTIYISAVSAGSDIIVNYGWAGSYHVRERRL